MDFTKKIKIFLLIISLFSLMVTNGFSQDKVGTSAAPFLGINIGGAATAMGGAYVSMASDASALYWNPGAISRLGHSQPNLRSPISRPFSCKNA